MRIGVFGHGFEINYRKARMFQGEMMPWYVQVMRYYPRGACTLLWINHNPFSRKPNSEAARVRTIRLWG